MKMLLLLQERARELGVDLQFQSPFASAEEHRHGYDVVVARTASTRWCGPSSPTCSGPTSTPACASSSGSAPTRSSTTRSPSFGGERARLEDKIHAYQFDADTATVIVECSTQRTWDAWGFEDMSKEETIATCEQVFAKHLGGHSLISSTHHLRGSAQGMELASDLRALVPRERRVDGRCRSHWALLDRLGHPPFPSTTIALAELLHTESTMEGVLRRYQDERRLEVLRLQSAARSSLEWFEQCERYLDLHPVQFNYSLLTRSQRISHENLRLRDPAWLRLGGELVPGAGGRDARPGADVRARLRGMELINRVVVSPMAQYKARRRLPDRLALRSLRRAGEGGVDLSTPR